MSLLSFLKTAHAEEAMVWCRLNVCQQLSWISPAYIFLKNWTSFYFIQEHWSEETALLNEIILHWIVGFCVTVCIWKGLFPLGSVFWHEMSLKINQPCGMWAPNIICCLYLLSTGVSLSLFLIYSYHLPHINIGTS